MRRALAITLLLLFSQICLAQSKERDIERFFDRYVDNLKKAEYADAANCWAIYDRTISDQLKLQYPNEPVKLEMESPLWANIEAIRDGSATVKVDTVRFNRDFASISYSVHKGDKVIPGKSYAISESVLNPQLVSPLRVFCESWDEARSRFMSVKFRDKTLLQQSSLEDADAFIEATGKKLGLSNEQMIVLETIKFNAYLAGSFGEVEQIAGSLALGKFVPSMDAVVSKYMPPYHEIVQFLMNYSIKGIPSYTLPFMQHGTATFLGGRWGRSQQVLNTIGAYLIANELSAPDSVITAADFEAYEANPDFAYPVAGMFCEYLWDMLGREKYFELYKQFSGSSEQVHAITREKFQADVAAAVGKDWATISTEFKQRIAKHNYAGISPGSQEEGKLVFQSGLSSMLVKVVEDSAYYNVVVDLKQPDVEGVLLLTKPGPTDYKSFLFGEQFTDTTYGNQAYGVRFSKSEAGTYNYYTNEITGKYIVGVTDNQPLAEKDGNTLRFRVEKRLLPNFEQMAARLVEAKQ